MVFSSIPFLFFFLPLVLLIYYLVPFKVKNIALLVFSLIFYAWGEPIYIILMVFSSVVDYTIGKLIEANYHNKKRKKLFLCLSILINISLLGFFKYSDFLIEIVNNLFKTNIPSLNLGLPIGISFYTFQTMSYSIDVYRGDVKASHKFTDFMTYVTMFPQLIAGPIVRYQTVAEELDNREISFNNFTIGFLRFIRGLGKKVLIANNVGFLFTTITNLPIGEISILTAWLGLFAFAFQIYFDFSGYSDMAIGMGKMFGFNYDENFNYPYISKSITEFWRRWHISLSSWFRDYVYIPLGGSRTSKILNIRNILIVWALTGIWHGASFNFILWGLYYGIILIIEKFVLNKYLEKAPNILKHIYSIFFILIGWLIFAFEDVSLIGTYGSRLFGIGEANLFDNRALYYLTNYLIIFIIAILVSTPLFKTIKEKYIKKNNTVIGILSIVFYLLILIFATSYLVNDSYNPFLYFRF